LASESPAPQATVTGDWSATLYPPSKWIDDGGNRISFNNAWVYTSGSQTIYRLGENGCASMVLNVPADGWYIVWYTMQMQSGAKLIVSTGFLNRTRLNEFTGDGNWHAYPTLVEMQAGYHLVMACGDTAGKSARYLWSGAYDLP
jgi:hypothetical protein